MTLIEKSKSKKFAQLDELIEKAAHLQGLTFTAFCRLASLEKAQLILSKTSEVSKTS